MLTDLILPLPDSRTSLCKALVSAAILQDDSSGLLDTLSTSLQAAFSPDEVSLAAGREICSEALLKVATLAGKGFLHGVESASQSVADLISSYTVLHNKYNGNTTQYPVDQAVSDNKYSVTAISKNAVFILMYTI